MSFETHENLPGGKDNSSLASNMEKTQPVVRKAHLSLSQLINEQVVSAATDDSLNYENISVDYQPNSMTDVTALLNLHPTTSNTSIEGERTSSMKLISSVENNGAIHLLDSSGRLYYIAPSEGDANTNISIVGNGDGELERYNIPVSEVLDAADLTDSYNPPTSIDNGSAPVCAEPDTPTKGRKKKRKTRVYGEKKGGWPKGKKRRVTENRIKPPSSAYVIFARRRRKEIMNEDPCCSFSEATKIMGKEWTTMPIDQKENYNRQAEEDKQRFKRELNDYQQSAEYKEIIKRKREENQLSRTNISADEADKWEEEMKLYCRICDQRFNNPHNRAEHLAGKQHLNNLQQEIRKQAANATTTNEKTCTCGFKPPSTFCPEGDESLDINSTIESIVNLQAKRESEIELLKQNLVLLKEKNSRYSQQILSLQDTEAKLKEELQNQKAWSLNLSRDIDNLKMVPTLFGVINF